MMLVAVPYALRAADADTLGGEPASSFVRSRTDGRLESGANLFDSPLVDGSGVPGQIAKWASSTVLSSSTISECASNGIGFGLTDPTGGGVVDSFGRALEQVARLQPVHFYWRADEYADRHFGSSQSLGLIAQDVEAVLPELVTTDEQGYKAVRYHALPMVLLQAVKDLKAEHDDLKGRLELQEEQLRRLEIQRSR